MSFRNRVRQRSDRPESVAIAAENSRFHAEQQTLAAVQTHKALVESIDQKEKVLKSIEDQIQSSICEIDKLNLSLEESKRNAIEFAKAVNAAEEAAILAEKKFDDECRKLEEQKIRDLELYQKHKAEMDKEIQAAESELHSIMVLADEARLILDSAILEKKNIQARNAELLKEVDSGNKALEDLKNEIASLKDTAGKLKAKKAECADLDTEISSKKSELQALFVSIQKGEEELKSFLERTMAANAISDEKMRAIKAVENSVDKKIAIIKQFMDKADVTETIKRKIINL